jgi:hypothetical protein
MAAGRFHNFVGTSTTATANLTAGSAYQLDVATGTGSVTPLNTVNFTTAVGTLVCARGINTARFQYLDGGAGRVISTGVAALTDVYLSGNINVATAEATTQLNGSTIDTGTLTFGAELATTNGVVIGLGVGAAGDCYGRFYGTAIFVDAGSQAAINSWLAGLM